MARTGAAAENEMPKPILLAAFLLCLTAVSPAAEYLRLNPAVR